MDLEFGESSFSSDDDEPQIIQLGEHNVQYQIIENCSTRAKPKLFDNIGFGYTLHRKSSTGTVWRCDVRNKKLKCGVLVRQKGSTFIRQPNQTHNHSPKIGAKEAAVVVKQAKIDAAKHPFEPASKIIRQVMENEIQPPQYEALPPLDHLSRNVNYFRQSLRPPEPTTKDFELVIECLPDDFLLKDIIDDKRHIVLATKKQLNLLKRAKTWFVNGTFKFVKPPFVQLFSFHAFVKSNDEMIQAPLLFCFMSRRQTSDYTLVFEAILASFESPPEVKRVILDFESAAWKAFRNVFPSVELRGCSFHFTQSIYRHVQMVGLQSAYINNNLARKYIRKLMALCYNPANHIRPLFYQLKKEANSPALQSLSDYVNDTWIKSRVFPPENWSVYKLPFRTNNDVEGWHHRINKKSKINTPFYLMVQLLYAEAKQISTNVELLNLKKFNRRRRKGYAILNRKIFKLWKQYIDGERSAKSLLKACSYLTAGFE